MGSDEAGPVDPAAWIAAQVHGFAQDVGSLVPPCFDAYARILHPARGPGERPVAWAEIAGANDRVLHPEAQWPNIAWPGAVGGAGRLDHPPPGAPWRAPPLEGTLPPALVAPLVAVLAEHTSTPQRCWFAAWEGWGDLRADARAAARLELPSRGYFLFTGAVGAAAQTVSVHDHVYQSASLWWPDDRAWCVATEVDLDSTYVGGTRACIDAVRARPELEVLEVAVHHGITWASDTINPSPLRA